MKQIKKPNPVCECGNYLQKPTCQTCAREYKEWICPNCGSIYESE